MEDFNVHSSRNNEIRSDIDSSASSKSSVGSTVKSWALTLIVLAAVVGIVLWAAS
ncbi:hypothetical protein EV586_103614 [Tumebacillus sp. BK434]|uniref:hypothetical protein n=1 Tax=Tumebacillus sp. BK434 TaxID=2512169 RepID=UPI0010EAA72F|nr:hypothetical protein [Tumebacillus sp. BK434]TCP55955.1 hypothetical protein EV586_103614 [Tumebacillus sp. BK434]